MLCIQIQIKIIVPVTSFTKHRTGHCLVFFTKSYLVNFKFKKINNNPCHKSSVL